MRSQRGRRIAAWTVVCVAASCLTGCLPDFASDEALQAQVALASADGATGDLQAPVDTSGVDVQDPGDSTTADLLATPDGVQSDVQAADSGDAGAPDIVGDECFTDFDCKAMKGQTPCRVPSCNKGFCLIKQREQETACEPWGVVVGTCNEGRCDGEGNCAVVPKAAGATCGLNACMSKCVAGSCVPQDASDWDDNNPCTKDFCGTDQKVKHEPITDLSLACDDAKNCTEDDACSEGVCTGKPKVCNDDVPCTVDLCDEVTGCVFQPQDKACPSDDPCTKNGCDLAAGCTVTGFNAGEGCDDGNACTDKDACDAQGACSGEAICGCQKDEDCKQDDLCQPMVCVNKLCVVNQALVVSCDNAGDTACAVNKCVPETGKCAPTAVNDGSSCADGDPCTEGEKCDKGACTGKIKSCDDKNPCTDDSCAAPAGCVSLPNQATCDDGNACTQGDACAQGGCASVPKVCDDGATCTADSCDALTGDCKHQPQDEACDDGNPCTQGTCKGSTGCGYAPVDAAGDCKDDGVKCTTYGCKSGACVLVKNDCKCTDNAACDDKNPCTVDKCTAGECINQAGNENAACDSDDKCQKPGSGKCKSGVCAKTDSPKDCSGLVNACNTAACNPSTGECLAVAKADGTACDADGNGCTVKDACAAGKCTAGKAADCSGSADSCSTAQCKSLAIDKFECVKQPVAKGTACEDGGYCTVGDACDGAGACKGGTARDCSELNGPCVTGSCDEAGDLCVPAPKSAQTLCNDGQFCTEADHCNGKGTCVGGKARVCAGATCHLANCDEAGDKCALVAQPVGTACSDGNLCTTGDKCDDKAKCSSTPLNCDDGNGCTTDACDAKTGKCTHAATAGATCSDGDPCTLGEKCDTQGACAGGTAKVCSGDACNKGVCDGASGQCSTELLPAGTKCNDGDLCTSVDACNGKGVCVGAAPVTCPGAVCNAGLCDPKTGKCGLKPLQPGTPCSDGDACTANDTCNATGKCLSGVSKTCAGDACNDGVCDAASGNCGLKPRADGTACDANSACTENDACLGGQCKPGTYICSCKTAADCDDKNACTVDKCVDVGGKLSCTNTPQAGVACSDGKNCTTQDACSDKGVCVGVALTCNDNNKCTSDFCDEASGKCATKALVGEPCDDTDACTAGDACDAQAKCVGKAINCDDGNVCTLDQCAGGTCSHDAIYGKACSDGLLCTTGDKCNTVGQCAGQLLVCDDKKECTADKCDTDTGKCAFTPKTGAYCTDGDACTSGDLCTSQGACVGTAKVCDDKNACTADSCNTSTGACVFTPQTGKACDDGDKCTTGDACSAAGKCEPKSTVTCAGDACNVGACNPQDGKCGLKPKTSGTSCDDLNACTPTDTCDGKGNCVGAGSKFCPGDDCNLGVCVAPHGTCIKSPKPKGTTCNDSNQCTLGDTCDAFGKCKAGPSKVCPGDACNSGICNPANGLCGKKPLVSGTACNDGDGCTQVDLCDGYGACKGSSPVVCPGDTCNYGLCLPINGQCDKKPKADGTICSDGNTCTSGDKCVGGACTPGTYTCQCKTGADCDDKNACTDDKCVSSGGALVCQNTAKTGATCDDGDKCTTSDKCTAAATCKGTATVCDDKNPCTNDFCDAASGSCVFQVSVGKSCDDANPCTLTDTCKADKSCSGTLKDCNDGNLCTDDSCDKTSGLCKFVPNTADCNDGKKCTVGDKCAGGLCAGVAVVCDDKNGCTKDSCDTATGNCVYAADTGASCDDGKLCTESDTCKADKSCSGSPKNCDDGNACTADSCAAASGACVHLPATGASCSDDNPCTVGDKCSEKGVCTAGPPKTCSDATCKSGYCDIADGQCKLKNMPTGTGCTDGDACTLTDTCDGVGNCLPGTPQTCAAKACNTVACDKKTGNCVYTPQAKNTPCNDNNACTQSDICDGEGTCVGTNPKVCGTKTCYKAQCNTSTGDCDYTPNPGAPCNDGKKCTENDVCQKDGSCHGVKKDCSDGYSCTLEYCNEFDGTCKTYYNSNLCPLKPKCTGYCKPSASNAPSGCDYYSASGKPCSW